MLSKIGWLTIFEVLLWPMGMASDRLWIDVAPLCSWPVMVLLAALVVLRCVGRGSAPDKRLTVAVRFTFGVKE